MVDAIRDNNFVPVALGVSSTDDTATLPFKIDPATGRLLTNNAGGAVLTAEAVTGDINDSNTSFTVSNEPLFINVNGAIYAVGEGIYTSYSGGTITLSSAVGTGGFMRSYYNA